MNYYDYISIIIYPYTTKTNLLYERSLKRGFEEGRFVYRTNEKPLGIYERIGKMRENYTKLKGIIKNDKNFSQYLFVQY